MDTENSLFTHITKLWLPVFSLAATIFSLAKDRPYLAWALFGLTVASVASSFGDSARTHLRSFLAHRADNRLSRRRWPEMQFLVGRFGAFVSNNRGDTVHAIATGTYPACAGLAEAFRTLCPVPLDILNCMWIHVSKNVEEPHGDFKALMRSTEAFNWLLHTYNYYVVQVVFDRASRQIRPLVTDEIRSSLESCRERYFRLIDDYEQFATSVNSASRAQKLALPIFPRSGPL